MRREEVPCGLLVPLLFVAACCSSAVMGSIMSVDLGGENMKIAVVKPGSGMEIVLNSESDRKTPALIAFRDGERHFGSQAENIALKFPEKAVGYLMQVIGRQYNDPQVQLHKKRFPHYNILKDRERGTVLFKIDKDAVYSAEELLGMLLEKAKAYAQSFSGQEITDAVITVPAFYNQAERRAVLSAAKLAGINVQHLMSDNAAVALNYGVLKSNNFDTSKQCYMFYDMGALSTKATVACYQLLKTKGDEDSESVPQLKVVGVGFDRTLGGLEFTMRLRSHLAQIFISKTSPAANVEGSNKAMAKLWKEAERVKKVLSVNVDHSAQIENLLDGKDFHATVTRSEFEKMCQDLLERVTQPVGEALKSSGLSLSEIEDVILMGGGTRVPKVQELLLKYLGRTDLGKSINTDEAAALGAVYKAATFNVALRVKKFQVQECNIYPIGVLFSKKVAERKGKVKAKLVRSLLFPRISSYPRTKVMTFARVSDDFTFNVTYGDLTFLSDTDRKSFGNQLISKYTLLGVKEVISKKRYHASQGIRATFQIDESGIVTLDGVEPVVGNNFSPEDEEVATWSTSEMNEDSSDDSEEQEEFQEVDVSDADSGKCAVPTDDDSDSGKCAVPTDDDEDGVVIEVEGESTETQTEEDKGKYVPNREDKEKSTAERRRQTQDKPEAIRIKKFIYTQQDFLDVKDLTSERFEASRLKLIDLERADHKSRELAKVKNELESLLIDYQDKLRDGPLVVCSTEQEREDVQNLLRETSTWYYEQSSGARKSDFKERLRILKEKTRDITMRADEMVQRPKALNDLKDLLNASSGTADALKEMLNTPQFLTIQDDLYNLERLINKTKQWREHEVAAQEKLQPYENPILLKKDIVGKTVKLKEATMHLLKKSGILEAIEKYKKDGADGLMAKMSNMSQEESGSIRETTKGKVEEKGDENIDEDAEGSAEVGKEPKLEL